MTGYYIDNQKYVGKIYRVYHNKKFDGKLWFSTMTMHMTSMFGQIEFGGELEPKSLTDALENRKLLKIRPLKYKKHRNLLKQALIVRWKGQERSQMWYNIYKSREIKGKRRIK